MLHLARSLHLLSRAIRCVHRYTHTNLVPFLVYASTSPGRNPSLILIHTHTFSRISAVVQYTHKHLVAFPVWQCSTIKLDCSQKHDGGVIRGGIDYCYNACESQGKGGLHTTYDGGCVSLRNPKVTKRLMSENTSRFAPGSLPLTLPSALDPVGGPLNGGEVSPPNTPSAPAGVVDNGNATRLTLGLPIVKLRGGSISRDVRNEVLSRSVLVLVTVRNESRRLFCSIFGVPLRSRI
jgi:hypothetical protein